MSLEIAKLLDRIGWRIRELQQDARIQFVELGRRVGLSTPAVIERVRRMEEAGIITGYRDTNATTPLLPEVFELIKFWLLDQCRNASAGHAHSRAVRAAIEGARQKVADLLRCSGWKCSSPAAEWSPVTSSIEHHAVLHAVDEQLRTAKTIHPRNTRPHRAISREGRR
jgi:hypothetical protein